MKIHMAFLRIILLLCLVQGVSCLWTVSKITAKSGGSVTIPCHYHRIIKDNLKYWCKGKNWALCKTMRPTTQQDKIPGVSFHDNPDELVITMTMTNLSSSDSNRYWCAVKRRGLQSQLRTSLELTVTEGIPDLSAASQMVSGEEGGNVTVQCLYSEKLRDSEKKWCQSGNLHSCQTAEDLEQSSDAAVQINDTDDGVFTVMLSGLKRTDAGWYWCMAGGMQAPVYINITSVETSTKATTKPSTLPTARSSSPSPTYSFTVFPSTNSTFSDAHNQTSVATHPPTTHPQSTSPENASVQTETTGQLSTSSKQLSTIHSSTYPTTMKNAKTDSSPYGSTIKTLTNQSTTVSSINLTFEPRSTHKRGDIAWVIAFVCGTFIILFILPGISWILWSRHKKTNIIEEVGEITSEVHVNDRVGLLGNEWTGSSVIQFSRSSNSVTMA